MIIVGAYSRLLNQLLELYLQQFPAILTYKSECDRSVVALLWVGNSATALRNTVMGYANSSSISMTADVSSQQSVTNFVLALLLL